MKTVPTSVRTLFDKKLALQLGLTLAAGEEGLSNMIENPHPQKLGLALAGYLDGILDNRIQIIGFSEVNFLRALPRPRRRPASRPSATAPSPPSS